MRLKERNVNQKEVLVQLRKERGLDGQGGFSPLAALRELLPGARTDFRPAAWNGSLARSMPT